MHEVRLWTGPFVLAMAINLVFATVFYMMTTTMALYAAERFAAPDALTGLAASAFVLGAVFGRLFAGTLSEVLGARTTLLLALGVYVVAGISYFFVGELWVLIAVLLVHGASFGAGTSAAAAVAIGLVPVSRLGEGSGYFAVSSTVAAAVGPFLAVLALQTFAHAGLFGLGLICSGIGLVFALMLRAPRQLADAAEPRPRRRVRDLIEPSALRIGLVILVAGLGFAGVLTYLTSYAQQSGMIWAASLFFVVYGISVLLVRLFLGRIQDTRGDHIVIYPAVLVFVAGLLVLAFTDSEVLVILSAVLVGFGFGGLIPSLQAVAVAVAPRARLATAVSTFFLMLDLGVGLGPLLLGPLLPLLGFNGMYLMLAGVVLASALVYFGVHGRTRQPTTVSG